MEKPLISVIVPVYNVEGYMEACLDSLLAQTWPNFEIILIDDASADGSGQICDGYADRDARVRAVHFLRNRGPSAARNEGVRRARGEFISFVDSDDRVEPQLLEALYRCLEENQGDISACGADGIALKGGPAAVCAQAEAVRGLARGVPFSLVPWGKLYRAELAKGCPFDEAVFYSEDLLFLYQAFKLARRVCYLPDVLYHYTYRVGSQVQSGMTERKCTALSAQDAVCADAGENFPEAVEDFRQLILESDRNMAVLAVKNGCEGGRTFHYLKRLQANVRRHFTWRALALSSSKKNAASILLLYASAAAFWGATALFTGIKGRRGSG